MFGDKRYKKPFNGAKLDKSLKEKRYKMTRVEKLLIRKPRPRKPSKPA